MGREAHRLLSKLNRYTSTTCLSERHVFLALALPTIPPAASFFGALDTTQTADGRGWTGVYYYHMHLHNY
jgi:hypothetical protein